MILRPVATQWLLAVLFTAHPAKELAPRTTRELRTMCLAIDLLLKGQVEAALDVLLQRVKAVERSVSDSGWDVAKWFELIPTGDSLLIPRSEARAVQREHTAETESTTKEKT